MCFASQAECFRYGLGTADALFNVSHIMHVALAMGRVATRLVQFDFSTAFGRVNHLGFLYKLRSVGDAGTLFCSLELNSFYLTGSIVLWSIVGTMFWSMLSQMSP